MDSLVKTNVEIVKELADFAFHGDGYMAEEANAACIALLQQNKRMIKAVQKERIARERRKDAQESLEITKAWCAKMLSEFRHGMM